MAAPHYCSECRRRIWLYAGRKPGRRLKHRRRGGLKGHDLCQTCWEQLKNPARRHSA